jgi:LacI family transcriptional regulator
MKRITIKDIAQALSLSISTVSRALSDHPDINDQTKLRVSEAALQMGYRANLLARGFRSQQSKIVALVLPEVNDFFTPSLISGISDALRQSGRMLQVVLTQDSLERESEAIQQCLDMQVEGVLLVPSRVTVTTDHFDGLIANGIPFVLIDKTLDGDSMHSVRFDGFRAGKRAVRYLVAKGHKRIVGVFGDPSWKLTEERRAGFLAGIEKAGLSPDSCPTLCISDLGNLDWQLQRVFTLSESKPTALFAMSDELLARSLYYLQSNGIRVPEDVSILAVSDGKYPYLTLPNISYIKTSGYDLGWFSGMMLGRLDIPSARPEQVTLPVEIYELDSVRLV